MSLPVAHRLVVAAAMLFVTAGIACHGNLIQGRGGEPQSPATLVAARRLTYALVAPVRVVPAAQLTVPPAMAADLDIWVRKYMTQVGLNVVGDARQPHDAEVRLTLTVNGAAVLMRGRAGMEVTGAGQTIVQLSTEDQIEPPGNFSQALAQELVEALVHSASLAAYAGGTGGDAAGGAGGTGPAAPENDPRVVLTSAAGPAAPDRPEGAASDSGTRAPVIAPAEAPADRVAAAKAHARQGSAYYDVGRWAQAYTAFEQAYLLEQDPALLYNMGQCSRKLGNTEEAIQFFRAYLRRAPRGASAADAEKRIRELGGDPAPKAKK